MDISMNALEKKVLTDAVSLYGQKEQIRLLKNDAEVLVARVIDYLASKDRSYSAMAESMADCLLDLAKIHTCFGEDICYYLRKKLKHLERAVEAEKLKAAGGA